MNPPLKSHCKTFQRPKVTLPEPLCIESVEFAMFSPRLPAELIAYPVKEIDPLPVAVEMRPVPLRLIPLRSGRAHAPRPIERDVAAAICA